mgnify:FL=1
MNEENKTTYSDKNLENNTTNNSENSQFSSSSENTINKSTEIREANSAPEPAYDEQLDSHIDSRATLVASNNINDAIGSTATSLVAISPFTLFLQWITYALWGWALLPLSMLILLVSTYYIKGDVGTDEFVIYLIASILVLAPLAMVADHFYSKSEPQPKKGGSLVIMLIHAVIFVLFGLGFFISTVFAVINAVMSSSSPEQSIAIAIGSFVVGLLYLLLIIRTIKPNLLQFKTMRARPFVLLMIFAITLVLSLAIAGPMKQYFNERNDRLIESYLNDVNVAISKYYEEKQSLPDSLNELSVESEVKQLIDSNLVKYERLGSSGPSLTIIDDVTKLSDFINNGNEAPKQYFKYQLCVTYVAESNIYDSSSKTDEFETYISTYSHPKGEVCYKLKTYAN